MKSLLTIRHAPTHAEGLCVGRHDVPTTITHEEAARTMLTQLQGAAVESVAIDRVWSSPLSRCREPAARIARKLDLALTIEPRVLELHYGAWEGLAWDTITRDDGVRMRTWMDAWETAAPPGGESVATLEARVRTWWDTLDDAAHLLVAHAGVVRALRVVVNRTSWPDAMRAPVPHLVLERF